MGTGAELAATLCSAQVTHHSRVPGQKGSSPRPLTVGGSRYSHLGSSPLSHTSLPAL